MEIALLSVRVHCTVQYKNYQSRDSGDAVSLSRFWPCEMKTKVVFPRDLNVFITVSEYFITVPEEQVSLTAPCVLIRKTMPGKRNTRATPNVTMCTRDPVLCFLT